ncbi:hypothetical protein [Streptomyces mangrovisoli]|uniref:hypothetical protein n=1 Tax=Streptomyces mangrovisoli TaxID=1428628 RepID=UPI001F0AF73A|nr:hypothetical protein [Streptomyces mangrovisoli]
MGSSTTETGIWWDRLHRTGGSQRLPQIAEAAGQALVVLSETYAQALHHDLAALAATGADTVLIGGACDIDGIVRVPANAALRKALGGTLTSLNVRTAASWLEHCTPGRLTTEAAQARFAAWAAEAAHREHYARTPVPDETVISFIEKMTALHPGSSRTRLLRLFRDEGLACEQKRFADLYTQTMGRR